MRPRLTVPLTVSTVFQFLHAVHASDHWLECCVQSVTMGLTDHGNR